MSWLRILCCSDDDNDDPVKKWCDVWYVLQICCRKFSSDVKCWILTHVLKYYVEEDNDDDDYAVDNDDDEKIGPCTLYLTACFVVLIYIFLHNISNLRSFKL